TDGLLHNVGFLRPVNADGVSDTGRRAVTEGSDDAFKFVTPSLRNVALTAPYFHDGSVATLEEVVARYNSVTRDNTFMKNGGASDEMSLAIDLTASEQAALIAFLRTLTSGPSSLSAPTYADAIVAAPNQLSFAAGSKTWSAGAGVQLNAKQFRFRPDGLP